MANSPTPSQLAHAKRVVGYQPRDPLSGDRTCRWCLFPAPAAHQKDGEYLCPQCLRWQADKAYPDGVPGLTQAREACRWCGGETPFAPGEDDGMKRCAHCHADMHPAAALALHGQAIVPETVEAGPVGRVALTGRLGLAARYRTVTDPADLPDQGV